MSAGTEQRPERRWEIEEEQGEDGRHVLYYRWPAETEAEGAYGGANRQDPYDPAEPLADADV